MINADELTKLIRAEADLISEPPISDEAVQNAAGVALHLWGDAGGANPLTSAA